MTELEQARLEQAFQAAKEWKQQRASHRNDGGGGWEEPKTNFEKAKNDIMLDMVTNFFRIPALGRQRQEDF